MTDGRSGEGESGGAAGAETTPAAPVGNGRATEVVLRRRGPTYTSSGQPGLAVCLSGGGFRAVFYHLGALRCINDLGALHRIRLVSSVSGGSVMAAHLATALDWPLSGPVPPDEWEAKVAGPLRRFASRDRRSWPLVAGTLNPASSCADELAGQWRELLGDRVLADLPKSPEFVFCATNLSHGALWRFEREQIGDDVYGFEAPPASETLLARAVAASATLAPFFAPLRVRVSDPRRFVDGRRRGGIAEGFRGPEEILLSDGGAYDNLGVEAAWPRYDALLVSDAGAPLTHEWGARWLQRARAVYRVADLNDQLGRLARRRWLISRIEERQQSGAYWGISSAVSEIADLPAFAGYSASLVREVVARVRTDLDAFTEAEQRVLENHGYSLASAALQTWGAPALGLTSAPAPLAPPHDGRYVDEQWVRRELVASRSWPRRTWRRLVGGAGTAAGAGVRRSDA